MKNTSYPHSSYIYVYSPNPLKNIKCEQRIWTFGKALSWTSSKYNLPFSNPLYNLHSFSAYTVDTLKKPFSSLFGLYSKAIVFLENLT